MTSRGIFLEEAGGAGEARGGASLRGAGKAADDDPRSLPRRGLRRARAWKSSEAKRQTRSKIEFARGGVREQHF
jgi:hypothetical protein